MLSINTNLSSIIAQRSMKQSTNKLNQAIERMTTGAKINHSKDNAANYNIATNMTTKLGALQVAEDNCAMGLDMLATANGTLDQIHDKLQRLRDLAVQASNGTNGGSSIGQIQEIVKSEATSIVEEIERLYNTTEYNGINLAKGNISSSENSAFIKDIDRRDTSGMKTLASVDETVALDSGTYSISTPEELAKLAMMTNNGLIAASTEFVLSNDIDLSGYTNWTPIGNDTNPFKASFDGNGYIIANMKTNRTTFYVGLFGKLSSGIVKNVAVVDGNVTGHYRTGLLIGDVTGFSIVDNCYSIGQIKGNVDVGGLIGRAGGHEIHISNSYSNAKIVGSNIRIGGLIGYVAGTVKKLQNCYATGDVSGKDFVGGFVGLNSANIQNCYATGNVVGTSGSYVSEFCGQNTGSFSLTNIGSITNNAKINTRNCNIALQVGISDSLESNISFLLGYDLSGLNSLRNLRHDDDYIGQIDLLLNYLSNKQIELGATENRLNSALEEISTKYENLVSSRSTLQDADIAEVSSEYIRQQILQQASATLLATANQSASIALSLI